ncbi:MAG: MarR family transcriptional regulator [Chloroflexales bacterium]
MLTDAESAAQALLSILPLLNRSIGGIVQGDAHDTLTMPQFRVLSFLSDGPLTVSELSRRRRVTMAAMGELAQALVERGLIERRPDPLDRRQQQLSLSAAGRQRYELAHALAQTQIAAILATHLSPEELTTVCAATSALQRAFTNAER